ncbi:MAG TPA: hypothetical protein VJR89_12105, partial [Polyangiales bacterium]|nr:hypothetical protein [Polyangiales bacterium]
MHWVASRRSQLRRLACLLCCLQLVGCATQEPWPEAADLQLSDSALPLLTSSELRSWSSAERMPYSYPAFPYGNKDFNNFLAPCGDRPRPPLAVFDAPGGCDPELGGYLIARDDDGPGVISRLFFTSGPSTPNARGRVEGERIRIYADDLTQPVYDGALSSWRDGAVTPFDAPFTRWTSGALVSYAAIPYQTRMRVVLDALRDDSIYYYTVEARSTPALPDPPPSALGEDFSHAADVGLAAGALQQVFERAAPGQLLRVVLELSADAALLEQIDLVLEWDAEP